jgi:hypothetical protein
MVYQTRKVVTNFYISKVNDGYFGTKISGYVPQVFLNGDAYILKTYI